MPRRTLVTLLTLATVVALAALAPQTPYVRGWLLQRVRAGLEASGIVVQYQRASGNPWRGMVLQGASVEAPGLALSATTVDVRYFLPSLLAGELPLSVRLHGVRGSIDVRSLAVAGVGSGGALPVTPVLQELSVSDARITVQQVPYTLPDGAVSDIRIQQHGQSLDLQAHLRTADGTADANGVLDLSGPRFDGQVTHADVTLARHWFPGATGGSLSGPLHVGQDGITADLTLTGGALEAIGLAPTDIRGRVELQYPLVRASLQGTVLGGPVQAQGVVNIAAQHWQAHASGTPALAVAAAWLSGNRSLAPPVPLTGSAATVVDASGWTAIDLTGSADGSGTVAGLPLSDVQSDFSYDTSRGITVQAAGRLAQGSTVVTVASGPDGTRIEGDAHQLAPLPGHSLDAQLQLVLKRGQTRGKLRVDDVFTVAGRSASATLDAGLNGDGWQAVLQGSDARGATLEGALVLAGGRINGDVRARGLVLPGLDGPVTVGLRADGSVADLPLALSLQADRPVRWSSGPESLVADLRGSLTATLMGGRLHDLRGALGPLRVAGDIGLAPLSGVVRFDLPPTTLDGPVNAELAMSSVQLALGPDGIRPSGTVDLGRIAAGPLALAPGPMTLVSAPTSSGVTAHDAAGRLRLEVAGDRLRAVVADLPMEVAGVPATVAGTVEVPLTGDTLAGTHPDLTISNGAARLALVRTGSTIDLHLSAPSGWQAGPLTVAEALRVDGILDPVGRQARLAGSLGSVPIAAALAWPSTGPQAHAGLGSGRERLEAAWVGGAWELTGTLPLDGLAAAFGIDAGGVVTADLRYDRHGYSGTARLRSTAPLPATADFVGAGPALNVSAVSRIAGQAVTLEGRVLPALAVRAEVGPFGPITIDGVGVRGSGTTSLERPLAGLSVGALPWSLEGSLAPLDLRLRLGEGRARLSGDHLAAHLRLPLSYGDEPLTAVLRTAGTAAVDAYTNAPYVRLGSGLAALTFDGELVSAAGASVLAVHGTPAALSVRGSVPTELVAARVPARWRPAGTLDLQGDIALTQGPRYRLSASWHAGAMDLEGTLSGAARDYRLEVRGDGLSLNADPSRATVTARQLRLAPLLPGLAADASLDGALSLATGRWTGVLRASTSVPADLAIALTGNGTSLDADVTATSGALSAEAQGAVLPSPRLHLQASLAGGAATLQADTQGSWYALTVAGTLATAQLAAADWMVVPPQRLTWTWAPAGGALHLLGNGIDITGSATELRGTATVPFTALGASESLQLAVGGTLTAPTVSGTFAGTALQGRFGGTARDGLAVQLKLGAPALRSQLGGSGALLAGDVSVDGNVSLDGQWRATVEADMAALSASLATRFDVAGQGTGYRGTVTVAGPPRSGSTAAQLLKATVVGQDARLTANVDLADADLPGIAALVGVPLAGAAQGSMELTTEPLAAALDVTAHATVAGTYVALTGHVGGGSGIALRAVAAGVTAALDGPPGGPVDVSLAAPDGTVGLQGTLRTGARPRLELTGTVRGATAAASVELDPAARSGDLRARLGEAAVEATLTPVNDATGLAITASAPPGSLAVLHSSLAGTLATRLTLLAGEVNVDRLTVSTSTAPTPLQLTLSGRAYPVAALRGAVTAPGWGTRAGIAVAGAPATLHVAADLNGLQVDAQLANTHLARLDVRGATASQALPEGVTVASSGLSWTSRQGFEGDARVEAPGGVVGLPGTIRADLAGHGALSLRAAAGPPSGPWAELDAELSARPVAEPALHGALTLDVPLGALAGLPSQVPLRLAGEQAVTGTWSDPSIAGPIRVSGPLTASGTLQVRATGGSLQLDGTGVRAKAQLAGGAWDGSLTLTDVPLGPFDRRLAPAQLSLAAQVNGGGRPLRANVSNLKVAVPGATLSGTATLNEGVRVALQVQADLAKTALPGPDLTGQLRGPLVLVAPSLADVTKGTVVAVLDVAQLGIAGTGGTVDGTLQIGGTVADPTVSAALQGAGRVRGSVRVDAAPTRARVDVHSTLSFGPVSSDVGVVLRDGRVEASGSARWGAAGVQLSASSSGALLLDGTDALAGWHASVTGDLSRATLDGPLASLYGAAAGRLALTLGGSPWLSGGASALTLAGVPLGDVALSSPAPGAPITLAGDHLAGTLQPDTLAWQLTVDQQPMAPFGVLNGSANGSGATGRATLSLAGALLGRPAAVDVVASNRDGLDLRANGSVLGGSIDVHAQRTGTGAWSGAVDVRDVALAATTATFVGGIAGARDGPALDGRLSLHGALQGAAVVHATLATASVEAALSGAVLGGSVSVEGRLAPSPDLTLSAVGPNDPTQGRVRLFVAGGALRADGHLAVRSGPLTIDLRGSGRDTPVAVSLGLPAVPGLAFHAELPVLRPLPLARDLVAHGLALTGADRTRGTLMLAVAPDIRADLHDVRVDLASAVLSATGSLTPAGGALQGSLSLPSGLPVDAVAGGTLPYQLTLRGGRLTLDSSGQLGTLSADVDIPTGTGRARADLHTLGTGGGAVTLSLAFDPAKGPSGTLSVRGLRLSEAGLPALVLGSDLTVADGRASGSVDLESAQGGLKAQGAWGLGGLLPATLAPGAPTGGSAEARVSTFQIGLLPTVHRLAPHLTGAVSGILRLRDDTVVAQLVGPDMAVAGTQLPLDGQVTGTWRDLSVRLKLADSVVTARLTGGSAAGLVDLHRFPAQVLAEAGSGSTDIRADVDGVLRFDVPFRDPASGYLRMATEAIRLERAGVVTTGSLAWVYHDRAFTIEQASFDGRGHWQARGSVDATTLDLTLSAQSADFGPLLGLVPRLARYGVGASGSFMLQAQGSPSQPDISLTADGLEAQVAGTHYRVDRADVQLQGSALTMSARVVGVAPLGGSLDAHGSARLTLAPLALSNADFRFSGSADLPVLGTVTQISGGITQPPGATPQLAVSGRLGNPFTAQGSLAPFDVTVRGKGIDLKAAPLFVTSSAVDLNVRLRGTNRGLAVGGELDASEIRMDLAGVPAATTTASGGAATTSTAAAAPQPATSATPAAGSKAALQAVLFDGLHLRAPQRVLLNASFGSAEVALDLTLDGTAAEPQLTGTASALRGSLRFAGRDFAIDKAVATFQSGRGVYPALDVEAHTTFDKLRVLAGTTDVSFASPPDSSTFDVTLSFSGQVQHAAQGPSPVTFDIRPTLTSDATVQLGSGGVTTSPRALTDPELLSLITLGRLEIKPQLAGQSGIGTAVAQSAIDTAVDVLVVNELQSALSKALGLDVVEIRTSPLSSLLDSSGQPFGVSLRLGGYLTPELFASYRFGNVTATGQNYAFTNEVSLTYDLGPLNVDLSGRLSFQDATTPTTAVPELGVGLRYAVTSGFGVEAGIDLSDLRQQVRFGVSLRW